MLRLSKKNLLIIALAITILVLPKTASAVWGIGDVGLFDVFDNILQGISERVQPLFESVIKFFLFYVLGLVSLIVSTNLLESFISQQSQWIANLTPMTEVGWNLTVGIANMLIIIVLIVIAFGFILKIEKIQAKKALPTLLGVAILINFSWLFVKMLIDLSQILYNTVMIDEHLLSKVMTVFFDSSGAVVESVISALLALGVSWAIPMASSFFQMAFSVGFMAIFLPNIIIWAFQAVCFFLLTAMFLTFLFLFAARVFVLQILIVISPLAFLSMVLPQTKKFWTQWLSTLIEWLLLGVFFLFFLSLGFGFIGILAPQGGSYNIPFLNVPDIGQTLIYYFAILIYMAVILFVGKQFLPKGAQELIKFAQGVAGTVMSKGIGTIGKGALGQMKHAATLNQEANERETTGTLGGWEKRTLGLSNWATKRFGTAYKLATGKTLAQDRAEEAEKAKKEAGEIKDPELLASRIEDARKSGNRARELQLVASGLSDKAMKNSLQKDGVLSKDRVLSLATYANSINRPDQSELLARGFMHQMNDEEVSKMIKFNPTKDSKYGDARGKVFAKTKGDDYKLFEGGVWKDEKGNMRESFVKNIPPYQLGKMATEFEDFSGDMNKFAGQKGENWFEKNAPRVKHYLDSNAAQDLGAGLNPITRGGKERTKRENPPAGWKEHGEFIIPSGSAPSESSSTKNTSLGDENYYGNTEETTIPSGSTPSKSSSTKNTSSEGQRKKRPEESSAESFFQRKTEAAGGEEAVRAMQESIEKMKQQQIKDRDFQKQQSTRERNSLNQNLNNLEKEYLKNSNPTEKEKALYEEKKKQIKKDINFLDKKISS